MDQGWKGDVFRTVGLLICVICYRYLCVVVVRWSGLCYCCFPPQCFIALSLRWYCRLANLRKRHAMKGRGDGSLLPLYSFASKTSAATQGGSPPGTSWGTPDSNKKFNHWRNTDPDESDTSFNLKYQQLLGKKQSRFNPERRSTCVVSWKVSCNRIISENTLGNYAGIRRGWYIR